MKITIIPLIFFATAAFAQTAARPMPAACGPLGTTMQANADAAQHSATQPQPGKALVYFIQDDGPGGSHQHYTIRIGMDGAWVGAYKENSYFAVAVDPGEHHLCANVQTISTFGATLALAHFTAEAGKTYYFRTEFLAGLNTLYPTYPHLELDQPDIDEAAYLIQTYPVSVFSQKK